MLDGRGQTYVPERRRGGDDTPVGINTAVAVGAVLVGLLAGALLPSSASAYRVVPVAAALAIAAAVTADALAMAFGTTVAYLAVIGFMVNRYGEISWHGMPDLIRLLALWVAALVGLVVGVSRRRVQILRPLRRPIDPAGGPTKIQMEVDGG